MNRTLLYTVQRVLDKLNLDPVNSINDTEDALLVAQEAENTFYDLMTRGDWPDKIDLLRLESLSDLTKPTILRIKDNVHFISSVRYKTVVGNGNYDITRILWKEPEDFLTYVYSRNSESEEVTVSMHGDTPIFVFNNKKPTFYTSFDNEYIIMDSYDSEEGDTLLGSDTICYGKIIPSWLIDDDFVIPLQDSMYPLFLSTLTAACSIYLTKEINPEEERRYSRGISDMRRNSVRTEMETFPKFRYGRRGNGIS